MENVIESYSPTDILQIVNNKNIKGELVCHYKRDVLVKYDIPEIGTWSIKAHISFQNI